MRLRDLTPQAALALVAAELLSAAEFCRAFPAHAHLVRLL